jgi:hypothetical protein
VLGPQMAGPTAMSALGVRSRLDMLSQRFSESDPKRKSPSFAERTRNSLALDVRRLDDGPSNPASAVWDLVVRSQCRRAHRPRRARA